MIKRFKNNSSGFVILYAVLLTTVTLAIGLILLAVIAKQIQLSSIEKSSQVAYYAADAGRQCALYYDNLGYFGRVVSNADGNKSYQEPDSNLPTISCFGYNINNLSVGVGGNSYTFYAAITYPTTNFKACVSVTVEKNTDGPNVGTVITSKGFNTNNCEPGSLNVANPRRVERTIVVNKE
jgi:hypothetical protein